MNGRSRLLYAAERNGGWSVTDDPVKKMMRTQTFVSDEQDLIVEVTYSGYTVKGARLWDFSDKIVTNAPDGVASQELYAADRDKAGRVEDVLLGNCRRF